MAHDTLIGGVTYQITGGKVMVDGTVYDIKKGRMLVGGTGYDIGFATPLSALDVGESVFLNVNGIPKEFIIVHQGLPSSLYDSSCDGIWLLMKDIYLTMEWAKSTGNNNYSTSDAHEYVNGTFYGLLDSNIQTMVKQAKIPYRPGYGYTTTVNSGANGLEVKCFLLSAIEIGLGASSKVAKEGAKLDYFNASTGADTTRVALFNGNATHWFTRSPVCDSTYGDSNCIAVYPNGSICPTGVNYTNGRGIVSVKTNGDLR